MSLTITFMWRLPIPRDAPWRISILISIITMLLVFIILITFTSIILITIIVIAIITISIIATITCCCRMK